MNPYLENIIENALKKKKTGKKVKKDVEIEEIVDVDGKVMGSKIPTDAGVATITAKKTTDDTINATRQAPSQGGDIGVGGTHRKYWGESDLTKSVGYDETMGKDLDYDEAKDYFNQELKMDDDDAEERLDRIGYEEDNDKIRLIEKADLESKIDAILRLKNMRDTAPLPTTPQAEPQAEPEKEISPILKRQLQSLKATMQANNLTLDDIKHFLQ